MPLPFIAGAATAARLIIPASKYLGKALKKAAPKIVAGEAAYLGATKLVKGKEAKAPTRKKKKKSILD